MTTAEFLGQYGLFLVQLLTAAVLLAVLIAIIVLLSRRSTEEIGVISIEKLNEKFDKIRDSVKSVILDKNELKRQRKAEKQHRKRTSKAGEKRDRLYVIDFKGDLHASATASLREEVSAILSIAESGETVLLRLENAGGTVHEHGLAASQLLRLKSCGLRLVVAVDKVAASGGYLMACVADTILAAPFAIIGSIGVLSQLPNFHRWLESKGIDFEQVTAGRYKRTLTVFGENTSEAREKVQSELEDIHALFKTQIVEHRPQVEIDRIATGEHWYGHHALERRLVDELKTSDEYLLEKIGAMDVFRFEYKRKKSWPERIFSGAEALFSR